jgi:hypothetical protein
LIRSGLFQRALVVELRGLWVVVGVYEDGKVSAPVAKYSDRFRAEDALNVVNRLADPKLPAEVN